MDFEEDEPVQDAPRSGKKKRFRKNKLKVVFDPEERKNFLLGFRKRKQERKEKYIEKLERDLAKEKKRLKQQTQRATHKLSNSHSILPEVQSLIDNMPEKEETYDLGNTLVSITSLDDQIYRNGPVKNEESSEDEDDSEAARKAKLERLRKKKKSFLLSAGDVSDDDELAAVARNDPFFNPVNDDELSESEEEKVVANYNPLEMLRKNTESDSPVDPSELLSKAKLERKANRILQESEVFKKMQRIKQKRSKKFRKFRLQPTESSTDSKGKPAKGKMCRLKVKVGGKGKKRK